MKRKEEKKRERKIGGGGGEDIELGHWYRESIQVSFLPFPPRIIKRANATIPPPPPPPSKAGSQHSASDFQCLISVWDPPGGAGVGTGIVAGVSFLFLFTFSVLTFFLRGGGQSSAEGLFFFFSPSWM